MQDPRETSLWLVEVFFLLKYLMMVLYCLLVSPMPPWVAGYYHCPACCGGMHPVASLLPASWSLLLRTTFEKWLNKKQGESTAEPEKPKEVSDLVRRMSEVVFSLGIISTADPDLSSGYSFILSLLLRFSVVMAMSPLCWEECGEWCTCARVSGTFTPAVVYTRRIRQSCVHPNLLVSKRREHDAEEVEEDTDSLSQHLRRLSLGGGLGSTEEQSCGLGAKKELKLPPTFDVLFHSTRVSWSWCDGPCM